jgi:hypothetical protein
MTNITTSSDGDHVRPEANEYFFSIQALTLLAFTGEQLPA